MQLRGDQQPEQEWSRNLASFVGSEVVSQSLFFQNTGARAGVHYHE